MINISKVAVYQDSAGHNHPSRLQALVAEQKIAVRGIIQQGYNGLPLKKDTLTTYDAVSVILERSEDIVNAVRKYNKAIKLERTKAALTPKAQ